MNAVQLREWLLPGRAERDEFFHQDILSMSHRGLWMIAVLEIVIGFAALAGLMPRLSGLTILATGAATAALAWAGKWYPHSRAIAAVSAGLAAAATCFAMGRSSIGFCEAALALLLLVPIAVPLRPADSLSIGGFAAVAGIRSGHLTYIAIVAGAAVFAAATLYRQRWESYSSYMRVLHASQELQSRLLLADSSKTINRLSAALAHELSQPTGAAASAITTLLSISQRQAEGAPGDPKRLAALQADLLRSLQNSMGRLTKLVDWFHQLTNLDETPTHRVNLNEIVNGAAEAVREETGRAIHLSAHLGAVPDITCRPLQLSWAFQNLLRNAIQATDEGGTVSVSTKADASQIEITIEDTGRGIPADQLARLVDPDFRVTDGRVSTGNWTLFASRQFIKDHGGDMRVLSQEGRGTTVRVVLPC